MAKEDEAFMKNLEFFNQGKADSTPKRQTQRDSKSTASVILPGMANGDGDTSANALSLLFSDQQTPGPGGKGAPAGALAPGEDGWHRTNLIWGREKEDFVFIDDFFMKFDFLFRRPGWFLG